jgi:hypothetical protein
MRRADWYCCALPAAERDWLLSRRGPWRGLAGTVEGAPGGVRLDAVALGSARLLLDDGRAEGDDGEAVLVIGQDRWPITGEAATSVMGQ